MLELMNKRNAWTNSGPVEIVNGMEHSTAYCRKWLEDQKSILVERWARNWADFIGWANVYQVTMPHKRKAKEVTA
jgi:hypothetical protein